MCPFGHDVTADQAFAYDVPCTCAPNATGHRAFGCTACQRDHRDSHYYDPAHKPTGTDARRRFDGHWVIIDRSRDAPQPRVTRAFYR